jgi:hypothetical protein
VIHEFIHNWTCAVKAANGCSHCRPASPVQWQHLMQRIHEFGERVAVNVLARKVPWLTFTARRHPLNFAVA